MAFNHQAKLAYHIKKDHKKLREQCEHCGKTYSSASHLKFHISSAHNGIRGHQCDLCEKAFFRVQSLKYHKRTVHDGIKKEHKCHICQKSYGQRNYLRIHIRTIHKLASTTNLLVPELM